MSRVLVVSVPGSFNLHRGVFNPVDVVKQCLRTVEQCVLVAVGERVTAHEVNRCQQVAAVEGPDVEIVDIDHSL